MGTTPKPLEIHFDGATKNKDQIYTGNIMRADLPVKGFGTDLHPGKLTTNTFLRQKNGSYEESQGWDIPRQGIIQTNIIDDMIESLNTYHKGSSAALKVKNTENGKVETYSYKEAISYLTNLKRLHQSKDHAIKEMQDLITYCSKDGGKIDAEDNAALQSFAQQHGLKLFYTEQNAKKTQELFKLLKDEGVITNPSYQTDNFSELMETAKAHRVKFDYKPIKDQDEVRIQDVKSGKTLGTVTGVNIGTKDIAVRGG